MERRRFLKIVAVGSAAGGAAMALLPGAVAVVGTGRSEGGGARWVRTVPLASLREGEPKRVAIVSETRDAWTRTPAQELGSVWLERKGDVLRAFSAACPHLGCTVAARGDGFACSCHDSSFTKEGAALGGPSPRGLDPLATKIEDGVVWVDFRRFRQGIRERIEVG